MNRFPVGIHHNVAAVQDQLHPDASICPAAPIDGKSVVVLAVLVMPVNSVDYSHLALAGGDAERT